MNSDKEPTSTVRVFHARTWLQLDFEAHGQLYSFIFPSMELQTVQMMFATLCKQQSIAACDMILCNDKHRFTMGDKNTFMETLERQKRAMFAQGGIIQ